MNSRERVISCIEFKTPDRAPRDLWTLPAVSIYQKEEHAELLKQYPLDISRPQACLGWRQEEYDACLRVGTYQDAWGSVWHVGEPGVVGEVKKPALDSWSKLDSYKMPWDLIGERNESEINQACEDSDCFMISDITVRPFERLQFIRGTENTFIDLADGTAEVRKMLNMLHEYFLKDIEFWCKTDVDGVAFMDDWGSMRSTLISAEMWEEYFKPLYKDYCDLIHSYGKYSLFHTDGYTLPFFEGFIEVGIDVINSQLSIMPLEKLAEICKGKITLWGEIDRQHILPFGSTEEVHNEVMRIRRIFDDGSGGVIAQCEWGKHNPAENIAEVFKTWMDPLY